ncbi:MAG: cation diffusion facilitator family transporter [Bacteroidota bacterium]
METSIQNIRIQKTVAGLSVILLIAKTTAYFLTGSVAILTDAMESIVNVVAGFFGLYSLYLSSKPKDDDHPYGHGKIEFVSAAIEGSMISLAGIIIIYEAIRNLIHPHPLSQLGVGMWLIGGTAFLNFMIGGVAIKIGNKNNSLALTASGKHLQSDTYSSMGILVGLALVYVTNIQWIDSAVALLFSMIIVYTGVKIIRISIAGIMDESDHKLLAQLVIVLNENRRENWIDLHNVRIIKYGSVLHLDAHLTVPWFLNVREAHSEIDELASLVRKKFGDSLELFVHSDGCLDFSCKICQKRECFARKEEFKERIEWTIENISADKRHGAWQV